MQLSSIGAVVSSPLSADSAGKSARERENNGICMPVFHTSVNTEKCKGGGHCSGMITTDGDLVSQKTCGEMEGRLCITVAS